MHAIRFPSRRRLLAAAGAALCLATPAFAQAQAYPTKPVKLVVPYPPGGPTDIVARLVAQKLSDAMGQQFIIDNRPGAGGNPGAELVARSPADGYTLVVATTAHAINPSLFKNLGYSLSKDFAPVSQLTSGPLVIVANPQLPAKNVAELIALAKAKPGELNFASSGNGQSTHLSAMPHVKAGKLKALAVTSATRSPVAPDVPTVAESGLPGYEAIAWNGLLAPVGTPPEVLARLSAELKKVLAAPDVKDKFEAQGFAAAWNSPDDFGRFMTAEVDKWAKVVKVSGAKVD